MHWGFGVLIHWLILVINCFNYQEYDYCPSAEEYISPISWEEQGQVMKITCYTARPGAITASGQKVHVGGCAGRKQDIGKVAYLYTIENHELVAVLEINDCGGHYQLRNGTALDVFQNNIDDCWDWINTYGDHLFVIIKEADG